MGEISEFTGKGQAGNWADKNNWTALAGTTGGVSLVTMNATLDTAFTAHAVMLLGTEAVTINAALTTLSLGLCSSFMVCNHAVATFAATSSLHDAGGVIVGANSMGTLIALGNAQTHATLTAVSTKIAQRDGSVGTLTLNGAVYHNSQNMYVGQDGQGTLNLLNGGQMSVGTDFLVGWAAGSSGQVNLASGARLWVGGYVKIGGGSPGVAGGTGTMSVGTGSIFATGGALGITTTGALNLAGGTVSVGGATGTQVWAGGSVSGFGMLASGAGGINDSGVIRAAGGTLVVNGAVSGSGELGIAAGSTLDLTASRIGVASIAFEGSNGVLGLAHGVADTSVISGFSAGDSIMMAGVDQITFNAATDVLTLSESGQVVDTLKFAGAYKSDAFVMSETTAGAMISVHTVH